MATFNQAIPDQGASLSKTPRVAKSPFGDGYMQRAQDGINNIDEVWNLTFSLRTKTVIQSIDTFLASHGGAVAFDWTTPNGNTLKFICEEWSASYYHDGNAEMRCTFKQVHQV